MPNDPISKIKLPNNTTYDIHDSRIDSVTSLENAVSASYSDVKTMITNGTLVPGTWYRITDYVATTTDTESRSANHPFDIIVMASAGNKLSEEGYAALHSGDTYFANNNLAAWKVWYSIDNDTTRFAWADSTNGKGVVYRLIDEFQNDLPFDFKGIQFKRYRIDDIDIKNQLAKDSNGGVVDDRVAIYLDGYYGLSVTANKFISDTTDYIWLYAFTFLGSTWSASVYDASIGTENLSTHNIIKPTTSGKLQSLTNVVFARGAVLEDVVIGTYEAAACAHNCFFAEGSTNLSVFGHMANNRTGGQFRRNIILGHFRHNTIASDVENNEFCASEDFSFNDFGDLFENNTIVATTDGAATVLSNRFESQFRDNVIIAYDFSYNVFNSIFRRNTILHSVGNVHANEFGVVYDSNFEGNIRYNVSNGFMKNCLLNYVSHCQFLGNIQYVECYANSPESNPNFTGVMLRGPINGASGDEINLFNSNFTLDSLSGTTNRAVVIESNSDGEIIATWKNADGDTVGIYATKAETRSNTWHSLSAKQDLLVSGTNIKTINNQSLLGSGNITISGGGGDALPTPNSYGRFLESDWDNTSSSYKWKISNNIYIDSPGFLNVIAEYGVNASRFVTDYNSRGNNFSLDSSGLVGNAGQSSAVFSDWSWIKYRSSYNPEQYVTLQDTLDALGLPSVTSSDCGRMLSVDVNSTVGYHWSKNSPFHFESLNMIGDPYWGIMLQNSLDEQLLLSHEGLYYYMDSERSAEFKNWNWITYNYYDSTAGTRFGVGLQDTLDAKQATLVSGTNIKTINNQSLLGSGNITISGGGGDTSTCVHKTGDETVGGDKTFTDNVGVVDADHIVYSGGGGGGGFTRGVSYGAISGQTITFTGLSGEPKAFVLSAIIDAIGAGNYTNGVVSVVMDSTGCHAIYNTGTQHNYSSGFTTSYSNGTLVVTAPAGVTWPTSGMESYGLVYYYGSGTLTFKTSTIQPGSGVTSVTFTGTDLTEIPAMYACFLESAVNSESYRRVALYTNSALDDGGTQVSLGITFYSQLMANTTSSFTATYQTGYSAGLNINSGGTNAGGYFHTPGTYVLYYLMASDVAGGGSSGYQSLGDELDDIRDTIGDIATILASI